MGLLVDDDYSTGASKRLFTPAAVEAGSEEARVAMAGSRRGLWFVEPSGYASSAEWRQQFAYGREVMGASSLPHVHPEARFGEGGEDKDLWRRTVRSRTTRRGTTASSSSTEATPPLM